MDQNSPYVLFADDDPDDLDLLVPAFTGRNPEIRAFTVTSGEEFLAWADTCSSIEYPLFILLDYKIGNMTAADILNVIKHMGRFDSIPKFVWSTSMREDHVKQCLELGAEAYLAKPDDNKSLEKVVVRLTSAIKKTQPLH